MVRELATDVLRRDGARTLVLTRLTPADVAQTLHESLPDRADRALWAERVHGATGGLPLLVREAVRSLRTSAGDPEPPTVLSLASNPATAAIITESLDRVTPACRSLLQLAAIMSPGADIGLLVAVAGHEEADVLERLDEARYAGGILAESAHGDEVAFDHDLIREVLIGEVSSSRRARVHRELAAVVRSRGDCLRAARHALLASAVIPHTDLATWVTEGADHALASLAFESARDILQEGLEITGNSLDPGSRADLLLRLGRALSLGGLPAEAEKAWLDAADAARSVRDTERLALIALGTDPHARLVNLFEQRETLLHEALAALGPNWTALRLRVASALLTETSMPARGTIPEGLGDEVLREARALGDDATLVGALHARHMSERAGSPHRRRPWAAELLASAQRLGDSYWIHQAHLALLIDATATGDAPAAAASLAALEEAAERLGTPPARWRMSITRATWQRLRGEYEAADASAAAAFEIGSRYQIADADIAFAAHTFLTTFHRGSLAPLLTSLEEYAKARPEIVAWGLGAGLAAVAAGERRRATAMLERALAALPPAEWDETRVLAICLASELGHAVGVSAVDATRLDDWLAPHANEIVVFGALAGDFGPVDRARGLLAAAQGDIAEAELRFRAAADICRRFGAQPWLRRTMVNWRSVVGPESTFAELP
jgi:tetratricopeptide (TPR) repeat protein